MNHKETQCGENPEAEARAELQVVEVVFLVGQIVRIIRIPQVRHLQLIIY